MNKRTYAGIPEQFGKIETSKIVLIPVPYDGTSTWQKGASNGPEAFLKASENIELYDIETDSEVYKNGIYLADPVTENASPEKMVEAVHTLTKFYIKKNKFVTLFGGEHSMSIGSIKAFNECFNSLTVVHIGAHTNLKKEYQGSSANRKCALYEASQNTNLIQVGIRSMSQIEKTMIEEEKTFFAHQLAQDDYWMENAIDLMTENVFITIDLAGFDHSIMPSAGFPEPGGLLWFETLEFLQKTFNEKNVVGFDIAELCPNEKNKSSDLVAAKLYYKMLSYKFENSEANDYEDVDGFKDPNQKNSKFEDEDYE
ncbi:agmatinase [Lutibacter sp. HS1-25]|uniref:agmatinase n=1 Tax=Lutibacter sp. HS1-25 TaxID=2485000 RepID=UPI0010108CBD|nr:agmatinase [Lutibacter sp. HS1-25]RXP58613.1 agmatinase [Lutibacter sp. HS1-25]